MPSKVFGCRTFHLLADHFVYQLLARLASTSGPRSSDLRIEKRVNAAIGRQCGLMIVAVFQNCFRRRQQ